MTINSDKLCSRFRCIDNPARTQNKTPTKVDKNLHLHRDLASTSTRLVSALAFIFPFSLVQHLKTMASSKIFSLEGKGLKLDTAADVEAHIKPLVEMDDVEEVRLLGNTLGVEACEAIGKVLATKKTLQVHPPPNHDPSLLTLLCADSKPRRYIYRSPLG